MISKQYVDGLEIRHNELLNKIEQLQAQCAELERERDALAAHVGRLRGVSMRACTAPYESPAYGVKTKGYFISELADVLEETPQQSLAKHDAEVARKAFVAGANWQAGGLAFNQPVINREANQYIEQLKEKGNE